MGAAEAVKPYYEQGDGKQHIAQKPLEVMSWLLRIVPDGGLVCDPFMGSGSTLVAAKAAGLPAVGIDAEERYCAIAAKRLSQEVFAFP